MAYRGIGTTPTTGPRYTMRTWLGRAAAAGLVMTLAACAWPSQGATRAATPTTGSSSATPTPPMSPSATASTATASTAPASASPASASPDTPGVSPSPVPSGEPANTPDPSPTPAPDPAATASPAATATQAEPAPTEPPAPAYLQRGSSGPEVLALQQRLHDLGYGLLTPDGSFGSATQQAVWAFQKAAGLPRDGVIGPQTQTALDKGYRPAPRLTSGHVVEIDLERQIVMAVDNGHVTRVINASSGNGKKYTALGRQYVAQTPRGTFKVYMQDDGVHSSTLELGDMWRPKYFSGGIAVHGAASIPPYPASHGCVRVSNGAMNWLWDSWGMPIGTTVLVY